MSNHVSRMIEAVDGGIRLHLFIQPKSSKNEVVGKHDGEIKIKLTAPPVDGAANECLVEFLSKTLKVPKKSVQIIRGEASRHKVVAVHNVTLELAQQILLKGF